MNPSLHEPEQLVVQSLFADGLCKYSVDQKRPSKGFKIIKYMEEILPNTENAMTWSLSDFGMRMTLHREVPEMIRNQLPGFVTRLTGNTNLNDFEFAVHPGGPKIIEGVQNVLELSATQVQRSVDTLYKFGNMSSATLPHVWEAMAHHNGPDRIVSLAFGPGLTICGLLMERV
jgi:predicted naringenin-chalcone synthase